MGFNMSWVVADNISQRDLIAVLDSAPYSEIIEFDDLGTSRVPLASATLSSGWSAVFFNYALAMDATLGANPPRLARLPLKSRAITCVVLEHAMISHASLWQDGSFVWQLRHLPNKGIEHLEIVGTLPSSFTKIRDTALQKQRTSRGARAFDVDYVFDVPLDVAATISNFRHDQRGEDYFHDLRMLKPTKGNILTRLGRPPKWWQTVGSIKYE